MTANWQCVFFDELNLHQLYSIVRLRNEVFVVEQNCVYQDADGHDQHCFHLMQWNNNELIAYARLIPPGIIYKEASVGRVVTAAAFRKKGEGKILMSHSINICRQLFGKTASIKISAQYYLKGFYERLRFVQVSDIYPVDGIPHIEMFLK